MSLPIDPILLKDITLRMFASAPREKKLDDVMDAETVSAIASSLSNAIYEYLRKIAGYVDPTEADAVLSYDTNVVRLYMASVKSGTKAASRMLVRKKRQKILIRLVTFYFMDISHKLP